MPPLILRETLRVIRRPREALRRERLLDTRLFPRRDFLRERLARDRRRADRRDGRRVLFRRLRFTIVLYIRIFFYAKVKFDEVFKNISH